jgi:choloylglycine hydrolase
MELKLDSTTAWRDGAAGKNSHEWTSKYGSVITAGFDVATADGLNEKGLAVNMLYLGECDFGTRDASRPGVSWSTYTQYLLDSYATVEEAVAGEKAEKIQIVTTPLPGSVSKPPTLHFSLSDATGDSAVFEWLKGKLVIHHGKQYKVMTNSPTFDEQLALNKYWETVDGDAMLPGTRRPADRFVRATYYESRLPDPKTARNAVANVMSVMRNVSVPFGEADPNRPNVSPTHWRTVSDNTNRIYYFESASSPSMVWVKLDSADLKKGAAVKRLKLGAEFEHSGDVTAKFEVAKPFTFMGPKE